MKPKAGKFEKFEIKSDLKSKPFKYRNEVPKKVLEDQFEHLGEDAFDGFFKYRNYWYHTSDFERASGDIAKLGWHGVSADSFFSGVLIALSDDGEEYIAGLYLS